MPAQIISSVENNFTKGLVTEFTGLNFPENAATDADNCTFTLTGNTKNRLGIDYETNGTTNVTTRNSSAINTYKWNNVGGEGNTQIVVTQIGKSLYFYRSSQATTTSPLSTQLLTSVIDISTFAPSGTTFTVDGTECTFADGDGSLFVFHPYCDTFACVYNAGVITAKIINVQIRDFVGLNDTYAVNTRPTSLPTSHKYNLQNQGWIASSSWLVSSSTSVVVSTGATCVFTVGSGASITGGDICLLYAGTGSIYAGTQVASATVTSYVGTILTLSIIAVIFPGIVPTIDSWNIQSVTNGYIGTFFSAVGAYPSNADVWWSFKNSSDVFSPSTTLNNVVTSSAPAPKGHYTLPAFNLDRSAVSGAAGEVAVSTYRRPSNGAWFQGRVWYTGVDDSQVPAATADNNYYYSWTENIYFSQIVTSSSDYGLCYQTNDPTSEGLNDILPSDGGVIKIQGCGTIYKLFPTQNGLLVFANNGIWFITGSQGIGFSATDYTVTKISSIQSISRTSFVNVQGLPYFWNEEGIYIIQPAQGSGGGLQVNPITVGTIQSFYDAIPRDCKEFVRGDYNPIDYVVQWIYRDTSTSDVDEKYNFNKILNFNTYNKAFYPYSVDTDIASINSINYVYYPGSATAPAPGFKYLSGTFAAPIYTSTFSDEHDDSYVDFKTVDGVGAEYDTFFITGYQLHGQGQKKFQLGYIYVYSDNSVPTSYIIQGIWDYSISGNSGKFTSPQFVNNYKPYAGFVIKRHRIRGQGLALQIKIKSVSGKPFDIVGWSIFEQLNQGV